MKILSNNGSGKKETSVKIKLVMIIGNNNDSVFKIKVTWILKYLKPHNKVNFWKKEGKLIFYAHEYACAQSYKGVYESVLLVHVFNYVVYYKCIGLFSF